MKLLDDDGENQAIRWFLACYGGGGSKTIGTMKAHLEMSGFAGCWPDWCNTEHPSAHLTKGGAQLWIRHLFNLETPQVPKDEPCEIEITHVRWEGDKLLATPKFAPQQQVVTSGERAELIADCRTYVEKGVSAAAIKLARRAADMLEADDAFRPDWVNYRQGVKDGKADAQQAKQVPMTEQQIEDLREKTFSTGNPYCPVDSKSMRKAARAIEAHHGIGGEA